LHFSLAIFFVFFLGLACVNSHFSPVIKSLNSNFKPDLNIRPIAITYHQIFKNPRRNYNEKIY